MKKLLIFILFLSIQSVLFSQSYENKYATGIRINSDPTSSTDFIFIEAPSLGSSITFTLPPTTGTNGQYLTSLGDGSLTWTTYSGGGGGASVAGNTGEVQFNNSSSFDASSNLFWDNTNNRLGIGTNTPAYTLDVNGPIRTGSSGTDGQLRIYSEQGGTDYEVVFNPSSSMSQSTTYTLPKADGTSGQVLSTDGSGNLSWLTNGGSGGSGCNGQGTGGGTDNNAGTNSFVGGGENNNASGEDNFIGGGSNNSTTGDASAIAGGTNNNVPGDESVIGAGSNNAVEGDESGILAGSSNTIGPNGDDSVIGAGTDNYLDATAAGIMAGSSNTITDRGDYSFIGGGSKNYIDHEYSGIVAGYQNYLSFNVNSGYQFIGAGTSNFVNSESGAIVAGTSNTISSSSNRAFIGTGSTNYIIDSQDAAIVAGTNNEISGAGDRSVIANGTNNKIIDDDSFIGSGNNNLIEINNSAIASGEGNTISTGSARSFIGSGSYNYIIDSDRSGIVTGASNTISTAGDYSVIGGGENNLITDDRSFIGAGSNNIINDQYSAILSGENNTIEGAYSAILGGKDNTVSGDYAMAFGLNSSATANYSVAIGRKAQADNSGAFVFADGNDAYVSSTTTNSMVARFTGGYFFYTNTDLDNGIQFEDGDADWSSVSDSNKKEFILEQNPLLYSEKILDLPISSWSYIGYGAKGKRNYGPMAQDFYRLFGKDKYGTIGTDTTISNMHLTSVGILSLQGLLIKYEDSQKEIIELKEKNEKYEIEIKQMNEKYAELEKIVIGILEEKMRADKLNNKDKKIDLSKNVEK